MHIKTFYGDGGVLKVTMKSTEDGFYAVIAKSKINRKTWKTVKYYKFKNRKRADQVYKRICKEF